MPQAGLSCAVVGQSELSGRATVAAPAVARTTEWLIVAWVVRESGSRHIRLQRLSSELALQGDALEVDPQGEMPLDLGISACGEHIHLAWQLIEHDGSSVWIARTSLEQTPQAPSARLAAAEGFQPTLACAGSTVVVAWSFRSLGLQDIFLRWVDRGGGLSDPLRVSGETDSAANPAAACADRRCVVAWSDRRAAYAEIYATILDVGSAPDAESIRVSEHDQTTAGAGGAYEPELVALDEGRFLVAWHDNRSGDETEVYAATLSAGGNAGNDRRISASHAPSTMAAAASCADGQGALAWRDRRDGPQRVMFAAVDGQGRRSSAAVVVSDPSDEASAPRATCLTGSTFAVAWTESSSERGSHGALRLVRIRCQ